MENTTINAWHNAAVGKLEVFVYQVSLVPLELQPKHDNDSGVMIHSMDTSLFYCKIKLLYQFRVLELLELIIYSIFIILQDESITTNQLPLMQAYISLPGRILFYGVWIDVFVLSKHYSSQRWEVLWTFFFLSVVFVFCCFFFP